MSVDWTPHRFSGGVLALDVANTIVLRNDPRRRLDRFAEPVEIPRFAAAASACRAKELGERRLVVDDAGRIHATVLAVRDATDAALRSMAERGEVEGRFLGAMLSACSGALAESGQMIDGGLRLKSPGSVPFAAALSVSALSLLAPERMCRVKICANCDWLFYDGSRNGSRIWCDMTVCGNRQKVKRHYHRNRIQALG